MGLQINDSLCRLCGHMRKDVVDLFTEKGKIYRSKIGSLMGRNVTSHDGLPGAVCSTCIKQLEFCDKLVGFFHKSHEQVKSTFQNSDTKHSENSDNSNEEDGANKANADESGKEFPHESTHAKIKNEFECVENIIHADASNMDKAMEEKLALPEQTPEAEAMASVSTRLGNPSNSYSLDGSRVPPGSITEDVLFNIHELNVQFPLPCGICKRMLHSSDELDTHMDSHPEEKGFMCRLCCNTYKSWSNLVAHRKACHKGEVLSCEPCSKKTMHTVNPIVYKIGKSLFGCEECEASFDSCVDLYKHYKNLSLPGVYKHTKDDALDRTNADMFLTYIKLTSDETNLNDDVETSEDIKQKTTKLEVSISDTIPSATNVIVLTPVVHTDGLVTYQEDTMFTCDNCGESFNNGKFAQEHRSILLDSLYKCGMCDKKFCSARALSLHKRIHPVVKTVACVDCNKMFRNRAALFNHRIHHLGVYRFKCNICDVGFHSKYGLSRHQFKHPYREDYHCSKCKLSFKEWSDLLAHFQFHAEAKEFTCEVCEGTFDSHFTFLLHYKCCHSQKEKVMEMKRRELVTCTVCKKVFSDPHTLSRHVKIHSRTESFTCEVCQKVMASEFNFMKHLTCHYKRNELPKQYKEMAENFMAKYDHESGNKLMCEMCGKLFRTKLNLSMHVNRHLGEKPYKCDECGKDFYGKKSLQIHLRTHTGDRPFKCGQCSKSFTGAASLYMHKKTHAEGKNFTCEYCERHFGNRHIYVGHVRLHTGERPYQCDTCGQTFTLQKRLKIHEKNAMKGSKCPTCGQSFENKCLMRKHLEEHYGDYYYACPVCNKIFDRESMLWKHQEVHEKATHAVSLQSDQRGSE